MRITGFVKIKVRGVDGKIREVQQGSNLVVDSGKELIRGIISGISVTPDRPSHVSIGSDDTVVASTQIALESDHSPTLARAVITAAHIGTNALKYSVTITNSTGGSLDVKEFGIFNHLTAGDMLARWLPSEVTLLATETIDVDWTLTYG